MTATTFAGTTATDAKADKTASTVKDAKADYEAAKKDYTEKKAAYDKALEAYNKAKEDQAAAEKTVTDATADKAGLNAFYEQKVKDAETKVTEAKTAADTAEKTLNEKKTALDTAKADAKKAADKLETATKAQTDKQITAKTAEVTSLKAVIDAANDAYQNELKHAADNAATLAVIDSYNHQVAENIKTLGKDEGDKVGADGTSTTYDGTHTYDYGKDSTGDFGAVYKAEEAYRVAKKANPTADLSTQQKAIDDAKQKVKDLQDGIDQRITDMNNLFSGKDVSTSNGTVKAIVKHGTKIAVTENPTSLEYWNKSANHYECYTVYNKDTNTAGKSAYSTYVEPSDISTFEYDGTYKKVLSTDPTKTVDTPITGKKVGNTDGTYKEEDGTVKTDSWYTLYNDANDDLDKLVKNNPDLSALKADLDAKNAAVTTAQTEYDAAQKTATEANTAFNDANKKLSTLKTEQAAAKNATNDNMKDMRHSYANGYSDAYADGTELTALEDAMDAAFKAEKATNKARVAKTDAQEEADIASEKLTRAKAAYDKTKASVKVSKPKIGIKRYGKKAVRITWTKSTNATRYQVKVRKAGKGNAWKTYYTNGKRSKIVKGLKSGKKYYAKVRGISKNGTKGTYSNTVSIRVK